MHVNEDTARELDLLAGLPWEECKTSSEVTQGNVCLDIMLESPVTRADLALGWLFASRADIAHHSVNAHHGASFVGADKRAVDRGAQCADLAVMATIPNVGVPDVCPYQGTREGARAAWGFIWEQLAKMTVPPGFPGADQERRRDQLLQSIAATFRRELAAMN